MLQHRYLAFSALALLLATPCSAEPLKIASWNLEHLAERNGTGCFNEGRGRSDADYERLRAYARRLDADIIALQEVENKRAVRRVFGHEYDILVSTRREPDQVDTCRENPQQKLTPQQTAFAVRNDRGLAVVRHPDYAALDVHQDRRLRYGVDVSISRGGSSLRLLAVHLKSGCPAGQPNAGESCETLFSQLPVLEGWIDGRYRAGEPFVVLGDFNRHLTRRDDPFYKEIDDDDPTGLNLWTAAGPGDISRCNPAFPKFIDHLVFDPRAKERFLDTRSFGSLLYDEDDRPRPSDHCPIYATLNFPPAEPAAHASSTLWTSRSADGVGREQQTLATRRDLRWLRNSAEYAVITQQIYRQAASTLTVFRAAHPRALRWTVAIDADETIFDNTDAEVALLPKPADAPFDKEAWRAWVAKEKAGAVPGVRGFLERVIALGGRVAVITNRDADQDHHTRANLRAIGVDFPGDKLCVMGRSQADRREGNEEEWKRYGFRNDKDRRRRIVSLGLAEPCWTHIADGKQVELARQAWSMPHEILMYVGDSIADLPNITGDIADSAVAMREIATNPRFVVVPNPTYGSTWESRTSRAVWE